MKFYGHYFKDELLDEYSVNDKAQNSSDADYRTIAMLYAIIAIVLAPFTQLFWSMVEWNDLFVTEQGVVFWLFVLFSCVQIAAICYASIHSIRSLKAAEPYSGKAVAALLISLLLGYFWFEILELVGDSGLRRLLTNFILGKERGRSIAVATRLIER